jgi:hypothetical protein
MDLMGCDPSTGSGAAAVSRCAHGSVDILEGGGPVQLTMRQCVVIAILGMLAAAPVAAQPTNWSEVPADLEPVSVAMPLLPPAKAFTGTTFYTDRGAFQADAPGLPFEDFTGTNVGPAAVGDCPPPLDNGTDDACFPPGGVIAGFRLNVVVTCPPGVGDGHYVVVTSGFMGAPFNAVGPFFFCDSTVLVFDPPVNAVGFDLLELANPYTASIDVFDAAGGPLGSDTVVPSTGGTFWGATSAVVIGRIEITAPGDGAELIGNLEFGDAASLNAISVLSGYGTALFCLLVAIAGLVAIIQRR